MLEFTADVQEFIKHKQEELGDHFIAYATNLWKSHEDFMNGWAAFLGYDDIASFMYQEFGWDATMSSEDTAIARLGSLYQSGALNHFKECGEYHGA